MACRLSRVLNRRTLQDLAERNTLRTIRQQYGASGIQYRRLHLTSTVRQQAGTGLRNKLFMPLAKAFDKHARNNSPSYVIYGTADRYYQAFSSQADYSITEEDRKQGLIEVRPDGEEVGIGGGMWHDDFKFSPTFSTWAHVTMLHLYLLIVRLRCLEPATYQEWHSQLIDHFFADAEVRMDKKHNMSSASIRQRYLKDLFQQWCGILFAYDEGIVKGDAVLASALWRNLFRGSEDVDIRNLAAIVSWMRLCLRNLDQMDDETLAWNALSAFKWPAKAELTFVDRPARALEAEFRSRERKDTEGSTVSGA